MTHMPRLSRAGRGLGSAPGALALAALLAACASTPPEPAPSMPKPMAQPRPPLPLPAAAADGSITPPPSPEAAPLRRGRALWQPVDWAALPGWDDERALALWPALRAGCSRPAPGWQALCAQALLHEPADDAAARAWLQQRLQPWRISAPDGETQGLATGYFEPLIEARRRSMPGFEVPLHRPPADLATRKPWHTRQQLDSQPALRRALDAQAIAWVADPMDALLLQIQGSGRLRLTEADGRERLVRLAFAGHNDQPYKSVGRWLIEQGELKADGANWPAIRDWGRRASPARRNEMLWSNPRLVFFREEALPDPELGPRGAQAVPLTPGRSVAVDPQAVPYGTPLWLDTTEPLSARPLRRLVMAQDTGSAITGAVRIDLFWGWGEAAEANAGRMKQALRKWALWPRGALPPG